MSEFSCPVIKVNNIRNHPNADALEIVDVFETPCIVRKGQLKLGDLAVYVPVEAVIPMTNPVFQGIGIKSDKDKYRVKAVRLRGEYSEGLLVPVNGPYADEGEDAAPTLGIVKYEEPEAPTGGINGSVKSQQEKDLHWVPHYGVESILKNRAAIPEGLDVVVTEKIHGCVQPGASIIMSDGSRRKMKDVTVGDMVLGMDENGNTVASRVLEKFDNGRTDRWLEFKVTNENAGRGQSWRTFTCTPNHEVFVNGQYTEAGSINVGDRVLVNRMDMELNPVQREVLTGKLLGDGSISADGRSVLWGHSVEQKEYSDWTAECLGGLAHPTEASAISGYGTSMVRRRTVSSDLVQGLTARFARVSGRKCVPDDLVLTPISLAFWYMDDGSLGHSEGQLDRANFATCGFTQEDNELLVASMGRLGISASVHGQPGRLRIAVNANDAELLFLMIAPYVHPSMQYKLPTRFRGNRTAWIPKVEYKPALVPQIVTNIKVRYVDSPRCDMHTQTSNYFVGGVLVHNCNARYVYAKDPHGIERLNVGSRTTWKRPVYKTKYLKLKMLVNWIRPGTFDLNPVNDDVWWQVAKDLKLEDKLKHYPRFVFYGEIYGKVQDLKYSVDGVGFRIFDIYDADNQRWARRSYVEDVAKELGLEVVPTLYKGPYIRDVVDPLRNGTSVLDGKTIREGIVIKPTFNEGKFIAYKYVGENYKLRKNGTEFH